MLKAENVKAQVAFKRSSRPKLTTGGVAKVFGIGRTTVWKWHNQGRFAGVRSADTRTGMLYDMRQIFELAYPEADRRTIALLMLQFRHNNLGRRVIK